MGDASITFDGRRRCRQPRDSAASADLWCTLQLRRNFEKIEGAALDAAVNDPIRASGD